MPITPFLQGFECDAETKRVMGVAFEMALVSAGMDLSAADAASRVARIDSRGFASLNPC